MRKGESRFEKCILQRTVMEKRMKELCLRPHHGMCMAYFRGKGYSEEFVENMTQISKDLTQNPMVRLTDHADVVCSCCPNDCNGVCNAADKVSRYDNGVLEICGLRIGDCLEWKEFRRLVDERILDVGKRETICGDCEWNTLCR